MKRFLTSALAVAVVAAGTGSEAQAQDTMGRRASLFDLGVYAGGAWSSSWFSIDDGDESEGYAPGLASIFGLTATYWVSPSFGVRAHGAYMPSQMPSAGDDGAINVGDELVLNNYLYDLDLVWRPMFWSAGSPMLSSMYVFAGGGGFTSNAAGPESCRGGGFLAAGVCVPGTPSLGTVGQGVVGLGLDLFPVSQNLGLFGELAVHGYDSPAHVADDDDDAVEDKFAFTPRASLGLKFMFGDILPPPAEPVAPPPAEPVAPPVTPAAEEVRDIRVCVIDNGMLREVDARYNVSRGDTMVNGQPFSSAYPATTGYAAGATWYINSDPITVGSTRYVKFGLPRVLGVSEVTRSADFQGVGVYAEAGATGTPDVVYIPVRPGCEFQPYQKEIKTREVRG